MPVINGIETLTTLPYHKGSSGVSLCVREARRATQQIGNQSFKGGGAYKKSKIFQGELKKLPFHVVK